MMTKKPTPRKSQHRSVRLTEDHLDFLEWRASLISDMGVKCGVSTMLCAIVDREMRNDPLYAQYKGDAQ